MSVIKLYAPNPKDGIDTYNQVEFHEATDSAGTGDATLVTKSIDITDMGQVDPGYTLYTDVTGTLTKYYATKFKNSTSGITSELSTWVLGSKDRWNTMFENEMEDTTNTVWSTTTLNRFKDWALDALYPDLYRQVTDTSLTFDDETYTYTVPFGIFNISEVGVGDVENSTSTFVKVHPDNWAQEGATLHFFNLAGLTDAAVIRLIAHKKYLEVGQVPEAVDRIVMFHMKMNAYLYLAEDFPRFKSWAQIQEGTKVSFENLRVHAREFERKFVEGKAEMRSLLYPSAI
jgi:hypothetical protein